MTDGVQDELINGAWPAVDTSGVARARIRLTRLGIDGQICWVVRAHEIGTPTAEAMDFRPKADVKPLELYGRCGDGAPANIDQKPPWTDFDDYAAL